LSVSGVVFAQSDRDDHRGDNHGRPAHADARQAPDEGRGAGPDHNFRRGGRLSPEYRNNQYVVDDWRGHHLSAPPRGYHWVQTGGDYVLAAIATGVIATILLDH
jgi:Ni/Co efflux regulator RcnB